MGFKRTRQAELSRDTLNAVGRVDILDAGDLETGSRALTRDDGRVGEEEFPDLCFVSIKSRIG